MNHQDPSAPLLLTMSTDGKIIGDWEPDRVRSLLEADEVEEIKVTLIPVILNAASAMSLTGLPGEFLPEDRQFRLKGMEEVEGALHLHYVRDRRKKV